MVNSLRSSIFNALRFTIDLHGKIHNLPCTVNYQSASLVNFSKAIKTFGSKIHHLPFTFQELFPAIHSYSSRQYAPMRSAAKTHSLPGLPILLRGNHFYPGYDGQPSVSTKGTKNN